MRAGRLRHRVRLLRPEVVRDEIGGSSSDLVVVAWVPAEVLELRGREYLASREVHSEITTKITIRYRPDIDNTWQVEHGSRRYDVQHVVDLQGRRRTLELMCVEVT